MVLASKSVGPIGIQRLHLTQRPKLQTAEWGLNTVRSIAVWFSIWKDAREHSGADCMQFVRFRCSISLAMAGGLCFLELDIQQLKICRLVPKNVRKISTHSS